MKYVIDTSSLKVVFNYYESVFTSFWENFNLAIAEEKISSVREVKNEIESFGGDDSLKEWSKKNSGIFYSPSFEELEFVTEIFKVKHFEANLSRQNILKGKPVADPFIIARAKVFDLTVITEEAFKVNGAKIPNICKHFNSIPCINLQGFMRNEKWKF
ncbi:MAG: DUF4411 family protein [Leptospiraceae bacterium]|nr:DUF4411 family protein [Leptospiraceae bacterium]